MHTRGMIPAGRPLRVLQVDPNANTPPYDRALCDALAAAGCEVTLLTSRFLYEQLDQPSIYVVDERFFQVAGSRMAQRLGVARVPAVRRALKAAEYPLDWLLALGTLPTLRPDIVHVQWSFEPRLDRLIWQRIKRQGVPLVYTVHNLLPHDARPGDAARYGALYRLADGLVAHSERSAQVLRERWQIPAERVAVSPHGPLFVGVRPLDRPQARRDLGLPPDAELILFGGLIEPYKGLADLIDAFGQLARSRPNARLVVAGKPNEPFQAYREQLHALGIADRVILDLAFLPEPRLGAYLCAADVVVLPYRATTASGLLLGARRFGCPVVATAVGDLAEVIVDGEGGLLSSPSDPDALRRNIERLLVDRELAGRLGAAGQRAAFGAEGWPAAADKTVNFYRRLLRPRQTVSD